MRQELHVRSFLTKFNSSQDSKCHITAILSLYSSSTSHFYPHSLLPDYKAISYTVIERRDHPHCSMFALMSSIKLLNKKIATRGFHLLNLDGGIWSLGARPDPDLGPSLSASPTPGCGPGWGEEKRGWRKGKSQTMRGELSAWRENTALWLWNVHYFVNLCIDPLHIHSDSTQTHRPL